MELSDDPQYGFSAWSIRDAILLRWVIRGSPYGEAKLSIWTIGVAA